MKFKKKLNNSIRDTIRFVLKPKIYSYVRFLIVHRYFPSFSKPRSWNEKIQYRKFYIEPALLAPYVDKYHVREYIRNTIGSQYLIPLLGNFSRLNNDILESLPEKYVIKCSNGGGGVNVLVKNKGVQLDKNKVIKEFNDNVNIKLGSKVDELFYDYYTPSIVVEELISNPDGSPLIDYKFHVFFSDEKVNVYLQINSEYGTTNETKTLYNLDGSISEIQFYGYKYGPEKIILPANFNEMVSIAVKLASPLNYARVDLYNIDGQIYFGEITVCPASGWDRLNSKKYDYLLGELWRKIELKS